MIVRHGSQAEKLAFYFSFLTFIQANLETELQHWNNTQIRIITYFQKKKIYNSPSVFKYLNSFEMSKIFIIEKSSLQFSLTFWSS